MKHRMIQSVLAVILLATLAVTSYADRALAQENFYIIYITENGDVVSTPPEAPLERDGDIYTFTSNIDGNITVQKDNIVIDGNNLLLNGSGNRFGFYLFDRTNVTIRNSHITNFQYGICLNESDSNTVTHNDLINNQWAAIIVSNSSSNLISLNTVFNNTHDGTYLSGLRTQTNIITGNNVSDNGGDGISICARARYNTIINNTVSGNAAAGIFIGSEYATGNTITGNNITFNGLTGIQIVWETESGNRFYQNNMNNIFQVWSQSAQTVNSWDNGYLPGGNYWSDYAGSDLNGDGIGDTPYIIDANNQDNYPFMNPWTPKAYDIAIANVEPSKIYVGQGYNVTISVTATNQGGYTQTFNITAYANQTKMETQRVSIASQSSETLTFTWNTVGVTKGFYTLNATADQMPGEIDLIDNTHKNGNIKITIAGDVNGDTTVNVHDLFLIGKAYGSTPPTNTNCDINEDNTVNEQDLQIGSSNYSKTA